MWTCPNCNRIFKKAKQPHSCKKVSVESHFENKEKARELFDFLHRRIEEKIGKCKIVSLPCCVHLFGTYDFIAILPKKNGVEIRFALDRKLDTPRLKVSVPMSSKVFKNCFDIENKQEIDGEFIGWLKESYHLKD
ncbi:MAG: DUF5655 domain-containing protein [Patescibacteria group bacterium]|nr:DUF5655 domain-containing protein [Patescibacteria group bacterium]